MKEKETKETYREYPKCLLKDYDEVFKIQENNNSKEEIKSNEDINDNTDTSTKHSGLDMTIESESRAEIKSHPINVSLKKEDKERNDQKNNYILNNYCKPYLLRHKPPILSRRKKSLQ
jgi:hypothetical protein